MPDPEAVTLHGAAGDLAALRWPGTVETGLLLAHATGFCKEVWSPVVEHLRNNLDNAIVAWDARAHGRSDPGEPPFDWWDFAGDALAVADGFEAESLIGIGHSMGGASLAMAEILRPGAFDRLVLIEPIMFPPPFGRFDNPLVEAALRRRKAFLSPDDALRNFSEKDVFGLWDEGALTAYVSGGLRAQDGEWVLRCRPEHEADVYRGGGAHGAYQRLGEIEVPVLLLAGEFSTTHIRPLVDDLVSRMPQASATVVSGAGHFLPMEQPARVAELIAQFIVDGEAG